MDAGEWLGLLVLTGAWVLGLYALYGLALLLSDWIVKLAHKGRRPCRKI